MILSNGRGDVSTIFKQLTLSPKSVRDRFIVWVNRTITHPRDKDGDFGIRVVTHVPIGIIMGLPVIGYQIMRLFFFYEKNEDRWISDQAWKDTAGALIGMSITAVAITGLGIWTIIHFL
jgi:hypothetical protein